MVFGPERGDRRALVPTPQRDCHRADVYWRIGWWTVFPIVTRELIDAVGCVFVLYSHPECYHTRQISMDDENHRMHPHTWPGNCQLDNEASASACECIRRNTQSKSFQKHAVYYLVFVWFCCNARVVYRCEHFFFDIAVFLNVSFLPNSFDLHQC